MAAERERLKIFSFDEGWRLLKDPVGRGLLASLQRMGRSELAVPIISTQLVADMLIGERDSFENLLGATFVFGLRSEAEAARALTLLGLDPEDEAAPPAPAGARRGAMPVSRPQRPHRGDSGGRRPTALLRALSTTPALGEPGSGGPAVEGASAPAANRQGCVPPSAVVGTLALAGERARHAVVPAGSARAHAAARTGNVARAPSGPPLVSGVGVGGVLKEESAEAQPAAGGDPLVENGLGSPLCGASARELSPSAARNCSTADFVAAQAPTANYAFDVNIDTGLLGLGSGAISAAIQDILVMPAWMMIVWVVHALLVALEWSFTLDLLDSPTISAVGHALHETQTSFTRPWLMLALAVASVLAVYHGLIRRRVSETVGQTALMLAMTVGGLWVVSDPAGTVGALADWADRASLGAFGAVAEGTPSGSVVTLADGIAEVFAVTIEPTWCYMEFGEVAWCHDPSRLDPRLRAAGLTIANELQHESAAERGQAEARSAELLRAARTNGQLFLALPANGAQRNSIGASGSLLSAICQSSSVTTCRGPTAGEAEFRAQGGTISRCMGLALIAGGALGAILTLGYFALRLLEASIMTLLYLLMAPAAVLAPAFGDGGRWAFRMWAARLFGAAASKLLYGFMLGAVLLMVRHSL